MRSTVATGTGFVVVDSRWTLDHGYETMVFASDHRGYIRDYTDIDVAWYNTAEEMEKGHEEMIKKWRCR